MFGEKHWQCAHGAIITILILLLILLVPVLILGQLVLGELADLYNSLRGAHITQAQILEKLPEQLQPFAAEFLNDLGSKVGGFSEPNFQRLSQALSSAAGFFWRYFWFFSLSIILRDGQQIRILPSNPAHVGKQGESSGKQTFRSRSRRGQGFFLVALFQGVVATIGFLIFGVPNPFCGACFYLARWCLMWAHHLL